MKRISIIQILLAFVLGIQAQNARTILDRTANVVGNKSGATANFSMSGKYGNSSGTIAIKGNMFSATTPQAIIWYDGKTQWAYNRQTDEVNVSTPTEAQQQSMNPYKLEVSIRYTWLHKTRHAPSRSSMFSSTKAISPRR